MESVVARSSPYFHIIESSLALLDLTIYNNIFILLMDENTIQKRCKETKKGIMGKHILGLGPI